MNTEDRIADAIANSQGKVFSVSFIKKDGTRRNMNARTGVTKHLKGGESTTADRDYLFTVFDMEKKGYRNVNLSTAYHFKCGNVEIGENA